MRAQPGLAMGQRTGRAFATGGIGRFIIAFRSRVTLSEFMQYQEKVERDGNNIVRTKWGAKQGGHDDTVTTASIAFRIVKHEFWLLTVCRLAGSEPAKEGYVSKLEQDVQKTQRDIHKQPSLPDLRRKALGVHPNGRIRPT